MGSEPSPVGMGPVWVTGACMPGPYRIPGIDIRASAVVTNTPPVGSYRGFGQPEAIFPLERAIDEGARQLGLDPVEVRRRNLVEDHELPFVTPTRQVLDSGHYHRLLDLTLDQLDYPRMVADARRARAEGRFVGVGVASFTESTNFGPTRNLWKAGIMASGWDSSTLRVEPDGHVRVFSSQAPMGQGIETVLAQSAADVLARPVADVAVDAGDTLTGPYTGYASGGSRGAGIAGSSVTLAARRARDKMTAIAAHQLEVAPEDVELSRDGFAVRGVPARRLRFAEVARAAYMAPQLPDGMEHGIEITAAYDPPNNAFTYGHVAVVVELDPELGFVTIRRMVIGHDCGPQLNPAIVHGQVLGGAVQGIGVALFEELPYDAAGQPRIGMMRDYLQPTAVDRPERVEMVHLTTPSPYSLTGVKGVGESGVIATPVAIANAIQDALPAGAPRITEMPVRPEWILEAIERGATTAV
jgi:carbon-monoxide dehydrogenase large subunit